MSGREKRAPADPAAEREIMRQLTRELHEAAQHAADERKLLLAAQNQIVDEAAKLCNHITATEHEALSQYFDRQWARLQEIITNTEIKIREGFAAEMAAAGATDVVIRTCGMILHLSDPRMSLDEWLTVLRDIAAQHTVTGCTCLGCVAVARASLGTVKPGGRPAPGSSLARAMAGGADILVATPEGLEAYRAAGGNPGVIIDAR